jgi:guanine deaminase
VRRLDRLGFLAPRTSLVHGVWLHPDEFRLLADRGVSVQANPVGNLKLGSGAAPLRGLLDAGVNLSLGSDGCGSIETVNLHPSIAAMALVSTLRGEPETWISAAEAFEAATVGGARALGREGDLGRLAPGFRADIALYRLDRPPFTPLNDPLRQLVYAERGANLAAVLVDGRVVVRDGRVLGVDEDRLFDELTALHERLRPAMARAIAAARALAPAMTAARRRCAAEPLRPGALAARLDPEPCGGAGTAG